MIKRSSTLAEVAVDVCTTLQKAGYVVVLTGGSAATYYAPDAIQSLDIDFVITLRGKDGEAALKALGYRKKGDFYRHPDSRFPIEFPPGPLAVGDDVINTWSTVKRGKKLLHVLSPTDSCRDRLASYLFWNDFSGLEQAIAVYRACAKQIDLRAIEDWCRREGQSEKFAMFAARVRA